MTKTWLEINKDTKITGDALLTKDGEFYPDSFKILVGDDVEKGKEKYIIIEGIVSDRIVFSVSVWAGSAKKASDLQRQIIQHLAN